MHTESCVFLFSCISECTQGNKIVDEYTSLENVYAKSQGKMLVKTSWTELLYSDFEYTAVIMIVF